jgi:hypothetical protein
MNMTRRKFGVITAGVAVAVSNAGTEAMAGVSDDVRGKVGAVVSGWEAAWNAADMNAIWGLATAGAERRKCSKPIRSTST